MNLSLRKFPYSQTIQPANHPTIQPSNQPTSQPPNHPTIQPSNHPTMWTCPNCERNFKTTNQSHSCTNIDMGELFMDKPDELVLAFDDILMGVAAWEPSSVGTAKHAIVFTSKKAWLIIKPMTKELDVKFYNDTPLESTKLKKVNAAMGKYAHHIRLRSPEQIDKEVFRLLRIGFEYSLQ